jgi:soluble lytic murein transglycosylase-like protein
MRIESGGDARAISSSGPMQTMPGTWVELSVSNELGIDPFDPREAL